ncbi:MULTISPECIES: formylglycine-generating enzyme family protein [Paenibacillus]|uniref:formylglycine-generating enzyme family protein n=1 Tax=Paenibacillus TaxID=44249 RepID=UPI0022B91452|nr:formylglycine-generating enzyme family protein [Paenibacillus caseinilyticus]MCZ8518283.1 formylglycine-generating enzyme family protein [Paenibacillus caseinilyticus]
MGHGKAVSKAQRSDGPYAMVNIPAGEVPLRDDRIQRTWTVPVNSFWLAPVPVTRELYCSVMSMTAGTPGEPQVPVTEVSWHEAVSFCNRLSQRSGLQECYLVSQDGESVAWNRDADGYRLPTEAEWQYACKAGTGGYRYGELDEIAWYQENAGGRAHEVGLKRPNAWGLYDMLGNVWEWCWDLYDVQVYGSYRVFRGGSWAEEARGCGATCRRRSHPTFRIDDLGFRLARSL